MDHLHWHLAVLNKAIHHKNLSGAAEHVGLSQPQLSRIVAKLEAELGVVLLDRATRRQSGWTVVAFKLAETYARQARQLTLAVQQLQTGTQMTHIAIGTLEGLAGVASDFARGLFASTKMQLIELNVYDLSELEERFAKNDLDLAFTCREPNKGKLKHARIIGFQDVERVDRKEGPHAFSPFEHAKTTARKQHPRHSLISNSLAVRRRWIETYGASGSLPSPVRRKRTNAPTEMPVHMIAPDIASQRFGKSVRNFAFDRADRSRYPSHLVPS